MAVGTRVGAEHEFADHKAPSHCSAQGSWKGDPAPLRDEGRGEESEALAGRLLTWEDRHGCDKRIIILMRRALIPRLPHDRSPEQHFT